MGDEGEGAACKGATRGAQGRLRARLPDSRSHRPIWSLHASKERILVAIYEPPYSVTSTA